MVYARVYSVANLAAFSSACCQFVAASRGVSLQIRPGHAEALSGTDFLLSEMKEYDA